MKKNRGLGVGRAVVVPGVDLEGMTADQRDRAMARWLFGGQREREFRGGAPPLSAPMRDFLKPRYPPKK